MYETALSSILLPTYPLTGVNMYNPHTIPPRLHDNIACGFAAIYSWEMDPNRVQDWVHKAYLRKSTKLPDNSRPSFKKNRISDEWTD